MTAIYLDHQASTPMNASALSEMIPCFSDTYANPHSDDHAEGWRAAGAIERARGRLAAAIGAEPDEIVFTSGATEANNMAILGAAAAMGPRRGRIVVTAIEHKAILAPARAMAAIGFELVVIPVDSAGSVRANELERFVDSETVLVSVGAVNNEIGTVQRLNRIAELCRAHNVLFHTDAAQALAWRGIDVFAAGVDLASFSAHKMGGPKGIGALYISQAVRGRVEPISYGGGQEEGLRPGTLPTPLCVGFGAACEMLPDAQAVADWREITARLYAGLSSVMPGARLNGPGLDEPRHPGNLSVTLPGMDGDALMARLQPGLAVARGSACTSGLPEPSHVLTAIGVAPANVASTIRFSTGIATTVDEVDEAVRMVAQALISPVA